MVILASIAIPYTLGYIEDSKNSKDHLMARHVLKAVQGMGTKYYHLGDCYQDKAYESVSNVVSAPSRDDEHVRRIKEFYHKAVSGNEDLFLLKPSLQLKKERFWLFVIKILNVALFMNESRKIIKKTILLVTNSGNRCHQRYRII